MYIEFGLYTQNSLQVFQTPWLHLGMHMNQKCKISLLLFNQVLPAPLIFFYSSSPHYIVKVSFTALIILSTAFKSFYYARFQLLIR